MEKYGRAGQAADDNAARRTRFAWWVINATRTHTHTHTHTKYVILIGLPLQQWFSKHAAMLCLKYVASLVDF